MKQNFIIIHQNLKFGTALNLTSENREIMTNILSFEKELWNCKELKVQRQNVIDDLHKLREN